MTEPHDQPPGYAPVSCDLYSELEVVILHRRRLRLRWVEGNVIHEEAVTPLDLRTREHAEYLVCRDQAGTELSLRLDCIRHWEAL
jgi:Rho-binding antiterminator